MEWDQYIFYKGNKLYKKIKERFKKPSPYIVFKTQEKEQQLGRFALILSENIKKFQITDSRIFISNNLVKIPSELKLLKNRESSETFIRMLIVILILRQEHKKKNFLSAFLLCMNLYPASRGEWIQIFADLRAIRNSDADHFAFLWSLLSPSDESGAERIYSADTLNEFRSHRKPEKVDTKESKQKLDLDDAELLEVDEKKIEEYTLGHNFEKIETVEEFDGQWRDIDGEENMEEEEALQELNLRHVIRTEDPVHTTRTTDSGSGTMVEISSSEPEETSHVYPEWDYKKKSYRENYCNLKEEIQKSTPNTYVEKVLNEKRSTLETLKKKLLILINERRIKKRLSTGSDFDLDALITRFSDIRAKVSPSENIYTNPVRDVSDMSLFFLMDLSLSTDSFIDGKRILDVERESLILFSECLDYLEIPFGIGGFNSRTHNHCKYYMIKSFTDSWEKSKNRMGNLSPVGYTRIGPALRHSRSILEKQNTKQKWIILLTDARPNDYDRYEGKYGVEDVNQAVKECIQEGIQVHTLSIGTEERPTIPMMMREASYRMLFHPEKLMDSLGDFLRKVLQ